MGDLGGAVERLGLGYREEDPQFAPELTAQKVLVVERAPVERLLFLVECFHGFCNQVGTMTGRSLIVFRGRSPLPGRTHKGLGSPRQVAGVPEQCYLRGGRYRHP